MKKLILIITLLVSTQAVFGAEEEAKAALKLTAENLKTHNIINPHLQGRDIESLIYDPEFPTWDEDKDPDQLAEELDNFWDKRGRFSPEPTERDREQNDKVITYVSLLLESHALTLKYKELSERFISMMDDRERFNKEERYKERNITLISLADNVTEAANLTKFNSYRDQKVQEIFKALRETLQFFTKSPAQKQTLELAETLEGGMSHHAEEFEKYDKQEDKKHYAAFHNLCFNICFDFWKLLDKMKEDYPLNTLFLKKHIITPMKECFRNLHFEVFVTLDLPVIDETPAVRVAPVVEGDMLGGQTDSFGSSDED